MRFVRLPKFVREFRRLSPEAQQLFRESFDLFERACDELESNPYDFSWPRRLRVEKLVGQPDVHAFTWSFKRPDGRATFQFALIDDERVVILRRVGTHDIYRKP